MELTTAMLADGAHVAGNKLYILGGQWDRLMAPSFPVTHPSMAVVFVIKIEYTEAPATYQLSVELTIDGQALGAKATGSVAIGHSPGQVHGSAQYGSVALPFNNVTFNGPGRYEWVIAVNDRELARIPLEVTHGTVPGAPASAAPPPKSAEQ
jgi:hypothetical protein